MTTPTANQNTCGATGSAFLRYELQQARKREAYERYNYASAALTNAQIMERLAEIESQHEPLAGLLAQALSERDRLYAAAFYVVVGRMPNMPHHAEDDSGRTIA